MNKREKRYHQWQKQRQKFTVDVYHAGIKTGQAIAKQTGKNTFAVSIPQLIHPSFELNMKPIVEYIN